MTNVTDFTFLSTDGKTSLHAMRWDPSDGEIKAVLQISHGVAEYIARYDAFARYLNEQGIAVIGNDHLGHGSSVTKNGTPVYFGDGNSWNTVVDDMFVLHQESEKLYPGVPQFLLGHSMGSFLARTYLIQHPNTVRAAVIMGTGWLPTPTILAGLLVAGASAKKGGPSSSSDLITSLSFGPYNKPFSPARTEFDWLSADTDNVDRYIADPLCGAPTTVGLFREMLGGMRFNQTASNIRKMCMSTPILLISGEMDPVGNLGKGVKQTYQAFQSAGVKDITLKLYSGLRHEILNEAAHRSEVFSDIYQWLCRHI